MTSSLQSDRKTNGADNNPSPSKSNDEDDPCIVPVDDVHNDNENDMRKHRIGNNTLNNKYVWMMNAERTLRAKTGLTQIGVRVIAVTFLIALLLLITVICLSALWPRTPHHQLFPICEQSACLLAAAQIQSGLNTNASICSDLWSWMCGGWLSKNPLPPDRSLWNPHVQLQVQETIRIRDLITTLPLPLHVDTIEWKLKHLYESCTEIDNVDADGVRPLQQIITELGGWHIMRGWSVHSWDFRRVLERLHSKYGATPFFRISVEPNPHPHASNANSIRISPAGLGLPDRHFYFAEQNHYMIVAYKRLLKDIVIKLRATSSEASKFSDDIFYFEKRIAEITPDSTFLQNPVNTYNSISVSEFKLTAASLPLREILVSMFPEAGINEETEILVSSPDYLNSISSIISNTDRSALNNYVIWTLVKEYLPYLPSEYIAEWQQYLAELTGASAPLQRWETCTNLVQKFMGLAVQSILEKQTGIINNFNKKIINNVFNNIRSSLAKHIDNYNFPTELYKHISQKATGLAIQIGMPKSVSTDTFLKHYYSELYVQKSNLFQNVMNGFHFLRVKQQKRYLEPEPEHRFIPDNPKQTLNVEYDASTNTIIVPRALLTSPYFDAGYPMSVLYGRIGMDIANAAIASVLPWDSAWTKNNGLLSPYHQVVNQSLKAFNYPNHCLQKFVTTQNYASDEVSTITSLSLFKHLVTVQIAQTALDLALKNRNHIHQPTLEIYEDDALFYITYSQNQCSRYTKQQQILDNFVHFQLSQNIWLQLSWWHIPKFMDAFQCTRNNTNTQCSDIL